MKHNDKAIGLQDLVEGFLFSLKAEGHAACTHKYYDKLLRYFLCRAIGHGRRDRLDWLDAKRTSQFASLLGPRNVEYGAVNGTVRFSKFGAPCLCAGNAAMVAVCGYYHFQTGQVSGYDLDVVPSLSLG